MIRFLSNQFDSKGFMEEIKLIKRFGNKISDIVVYKINPTN